MGTEYASEARKKMTIAEAIAVSVSVSLKERITGDEIVDIFHLGVLPINRVAHIGIMFAETHPSELAELLATYGISYAEAQKLYSAIPNFYHNPRAEAFLYGNLGMLA
jgi:hypothetical protein